MTNPYYNPSGTPSTLSRGTSVALRNEFALIAAGFALVASGTGYNSGLDTGAANAYVVNPSPALTSVLQFSQLLMLTGASNTNTGASTITVSGLGPYNITRRDGTALQPGDIPGSSIVLLYFDGTEYQLQANGLSGNAAGAINFGKATAVASASTVVLDSMTKNYGHITGTTTITAITLAAGAWRQVVFDGILTLTNGASLVLPGGANITTAAGDAAVFVGDGSGVTRCVSYIPASGLPVVAPTVPAYALTKIASATLGSPAAAISFLNSFSATYDNYLAVIENVAGDSSGTLMLRLAIGGSAVTSGSYIYGGNTSAGTGLNTAFGSSTGTYIKLESASNTTTSSANGTITFCGCNNSAVQNRGVTAVIQNGSDGSMNTVGAWLNSVGAITGFQLILSSGGNIPAGATVKVYGYQN